MKTLAEGRTDKGLVRQNNEDNFIVDNNIKLFVVADGAGGHATGEVASKIAVDVIKQQAEKYLGGNNINFGKTVPHLSEMTNALGSAVRFANDIIFEASKKYPQNQGMATTCVAVMFDTAKNRFSYCNIGDSRIYLLRDKTLRQITTDHSLVAEQVKRGLITEAQAETSEYRNVLTRALGIGETAETDIDEMTARDGDVLLLCTDGLTKMMKDKVISETLQIQLSKKVPLTDICDSLITLANDAGGADNTTVVLVQFQNENIKIMNLFNKLFK